MKAIQDIKLTYEAYLALPETKQRYEIIDGEMIFMSPAPTVKHQRVIAKLHLKLAPFVIQHGLGELFLSPLDVIISRNPLRTRQPDLLFIRKERLAIAQDRVEGAPDIVIEILSPGNTRANVNKKLADYARIGVRECWLVSPEAETIEVLTLIKGHYKRLGLFGPGDRIKSSILPQLSLIVDEIFN
jgi:Uma2 family endonuclease